MTTNRVYTDAMLDETLQGRVRAAEISKGYWKGRAEYAEKRELEMRGEIARLRKELDSRPKPT